MTSLENTCKPLNDSYCADYRRIYQSLKGRELFPNPHTPKDQDAPFRVSPHPFYLEQKDYEDIKALGPLLLKFYQGIQELYTKSREKQMPSWIYDYLNLGKPESVLEFGNMKRFRSDFPLIIRPDLILTEDGFSITELDSVPGGFGLTTALMSLYAEGNNLIGGATGIVDALYEAFQTMTSAKDPLVAIVVSDEALDYRLEMEWVAERLREKGLRCFVVKPQDLTLKEEGLFLPSLGKVDVIYRFFELFDLKNIPKMDLILYAIKKQLVTVTPPIKHYLEEKMLFGLFTHPVLTSFWVSYLGEEGYSLLERVLPKTWILDPSPLPPQGVIPSLSLNQVPVTDFLQLAQAKKKNRALVLKISGFSPLAWGSRGVFIGHDMPKVAWEEALTQALTGFQENPYVLQPFMKGKKVDLSYYEPSQDELLPMQGRVRLCPYYILNQGKVHLSGVLATICPLDKKRIHGMVDAIMAPGALQKLGM